MSKLSTVVVTGASTGISAIYAERWAAMDAARQGPLSDLRQAHAAERYRAVA